MIEHVHQALAQVRTMHRYVIEKQRFKGYSGRARALSGTVALMTSYWLSQRPNHGAGYALFAWLAVAAFGAAINYGAVLYWFVRQSEGDKRPIRLKPAVEVLPALAAGAALTVAFWRDGSYDYLVPTWMTLFGIANFASRHVLPREIAWIGVFYMASGVALLFLSPRMGLSNPWPMGSVFFVGEWLGGLVIYFDRPDRPNWATFFAINPARKHGGQASD
jgi:hypothetical protein